MIYRVRLSVGAKGNKARQEIAVSLQIDAEKHLTRPVFQVKDSHGLIGLVHVRVKVFAVAVCQPRPRRSRPLLAMDSMEEADNRIRSLSGKQCLDAFHDWPRAIRTVRRETIGVA